MKMILLAQFDKGGFGAAIVPDEIEVAVAPKIASDDVEKMFAFVREAFGVTELLCTLKSCEDLVAPALKQACDHIVIDPKMRRIPSGYVTIFSKDLGDFPAARPISLTGVSVTPACEICSINASASFSGGTLPHRIPSPITISNGLVMSGGGFSIACEGLRQ